jgi:hypothetical protein
MPLGAWRLNGLARYVSSVTYIPSSLNTEGGSTATRLQANDTITFGTGDFTLEAWLYITADFSTTGTSIFATGTSISDSSDVRLGVGAATNNFTVRLGTTNYLNAATIWSLNTWYHVALTRNSGTVNLWVDGVKDTTIGSSGDITFTNDLAARTLGISRITYASGRAMPGNIDECRISSVARYTSNFTPSSTAFTDDSDTLTLLHMDNYSGTTVYDDNSSGRSALDYTLFGGAFIDSTEYQF